jgi:hypothetical protein
VDRSEGRGVEVLPLGQVRIEGLSEQSGGEGRGG